MTGSLQIKRDKYHIVLNTYDKNGKRKQKWISTNLPVKGNKKRAEQLLRETLKQYELMEKQVGSELLFGDAVRFAANFVAEDSPHWEKAGCDLERFRIFAEGFLSRVGEMLTEEERKTLPLSVFAITVELASRFLDDYILGDPYFKINYPDHNLVRTRCQLALARDIQKKLPQMEQIIEEYWASHWG